MPATPSPNADPSATGRLARLGGRLRGRLQAFAPRSFQGRLTLGFVGVVALTLFLVSALAVNRLDDYFSTQERQNLGTRSVAVANIVQVFAAREADGAPVVRPDGSLDPRVAALLADPAFLQPLADVVAQADVRLRIGPLGIDASGEPIVLDTPGGEFASSLGVAPEEGQARERIERTNVFRIGERSVFPWGLEVTLSDPYTFRATTIADLTALVAVVAVIALIVSFGIASLLAARFTIPLRRLTDASRRLAEGDLASRVPATLESAGAEEIGALSRQFNAMAARLEESVEIIRRDRDRSRDFLADVSHELRTPLAALRTFNELLREGADDDPAARAEFLESSAQQLERLDWLAQNLLELSKLDSGLILLDLRPEDLRATIESAVEQAEAVARRRGVELSLRMPEHPIRVRHDPPRIGQVVSNLVANALKFTPRGGEVSVTLRGHRDGAEIAVADSGVGIDATELPRIFDRFYRGSRANEARGSGSGLGLAIVRSIIDMHRGRVSVESRLGHGSTFTVLLPHDPRAEESAAGERTGVGIDEGMDEPAQPGGRPAEPVPPSAGVSVADRSKVVDSSSGAGPSLNPPTSV